ncbi:MAG: hypothetical protein NTZ32_00040, partial [Planctomycetales bacterium]|nr:hypothetical protein [Planctomycetales bacterium]
DRPRNGRVLQTHRSRSRTTTLIAVSTHSHYFGETLNATDFASALAVSSTGSLNFTESILQRPPLPSRQ